MMVSRVDPSKTWLGTVTLVDYENPIKNDSSGGYVISGNDSSNTASKYPFYVELDSMDGLIMGQHLYLERYTEGAGASGVPVSSAYICYEEDGSAYVWAENSHAKLEKRAITLGDYNENSDCYDVVDGLTEDDYIAFPDEKFCRVGASTTHTPVVSEDLEGETGDADMSGMDTGMDGTFDEAAPDESTVDGLEDGTHTDEDLSSAAESLANGDISEEELQSALEEIAG